MKKVLPFLCFISLAVSLYAKGIVEEVAVADERAQVSYAFGQVIGSDLSQMNMDFDYDAFTRGFKDMVSGGETLFTMEEAIQTVQIAFQEAMARQAEIGRQREEAFLAENAQKEGIITTDSGLQYEVITMGTGSRPGSNDIVRVNYEGRLVDGSVFDSSYDREESAEFPLNRVIPGWSEGIQLMNVGSTYRFFIPSNMAYGERGAGQVIPAYSALIFKVELLDILPPEAEEGDEE